MSLIEMLQGGRGPQRVSQQAANYGRGTPTRHCGVCVYYHGHSCSRVAGSISGFGISDLFKMQKNPFGSKIGPKEAKMMDSMMETDPDRSPHVASER
jgi:hypothetical protein